MKVLTYTSPATGHLFPIVPILLELQRRGHEAVVRTLDAGVPLLREMGFEAEPIEPAIERIVLDDYCAGSPIGALKRSTTTFCRRAAIEAPELSRLIAAERPDALLVDTNAWGAAAAAEASGLPWALFQPFPTPLPSRDVPPFGPGLAPVRGPLGRIRNRVLRPLVLGALERAIVGPLNDVRTSVGVPPVRGAADIYTRPPLTIYALSEAFEYPRTDWPESFCFVGALRWEPRIEPPSWLADLDRPVVLVTTSSEFQDDGELVRAALTGLAGTDVAVVATVPAGITRLDVPVNAHVERFVPHSQVLPHAAVAVTHGGAGSTQRALAAGVPVVVVPWGRDQAEVARRAEATGAAVFLSKRRLNPQRLRRAVEQARARRPAAEALAARMATDGGAALAVDRIEQLT